MLETAGMDYYLYPSLCGVDWKSAASIKSKNNRKWNSNNRILKI